MPINPVVLAKDISSELSAAGVPAGPFSILRSKILLAFARGIVKSLENAEIEGEIESLMTDQNEAGGNAVPPHRHQIRTIKLKGLKIK